MSAREKGNRRVTVNIISGAQSGRHNFHHFWDAANVWTATISYAMNRNKELRTVDKSTVRLDEKKALAIGIRLLKAIGIREDEALILSNTFMRNHWQLDFQREVNHTQVYFDTVAISLDPTDQSLMMLFNSFNSQLPKKDHVNTTASQARTISRRFLHGKKINYGKMIRTVKSYVRPTNYWNRQATNQEASDDTPASLDARLAWRVTFEGGEVWVDVENKSVIGGGQRL